jgi:hypothetical protein
MDAISHLSTSGKDFAECMEDVNMSPDNEKLFGTRYSFNTLFLYQSL